MHWILLLAVAATQPTSDKTRFDALIAAEWEWQLRDNPEFASGVGDLRYNDKLTDLSPAAIAKRKAHPAESLKALRAIDRSKLDEHTQLDYDVLAFDLETQARLAKFPTEVLQLMPMWGIHTSMADTALIAPKAKVKDVENFIARMQLAPQQIEQAVVLLRQGLTLGVTPPRAVLEILPELARNQIPKDPAASPIYATYFKKLGDDISPAEQQRLREQGLAVMKTQLYPAYAALADFFAEEYVPKSRTTLGWSQVPDGAAWYQVRIREHTTTSLTPDEIHAIGLAEVKRIRAAMESVKAEAKFTKDLPAFFQFLRTDKRFFYTDKDDLVRGYRDIAKRIDGELPRLFAKLPRNTYGVEPVPSFSEKVQPTAYYQLGSAAAGRAGTFYCNTYDLTSRPKWEMEVLTSHEAVPGHHLQISLAEEADASQYRKYNYNNAYTEGWGHYSESLGDSLGLYQDPYSKFGKLTYEMWRAVRLVVDTGIHAKGWTRDQAIAFFKDNAGKAQHDIEVEVDRYIAWPGQALAYKIGQMKLLALRDKAKSALGDKFDIRAFHDAVLDDGALPLEVLERRIDAWIAASLRQTARVSPR